MRDKATDDFEDAEMRVDGAALSLAKPLIEGWVLHPAGLHLSNGPEKFIRWCEIETQSVFPSFPERKDVSNCLWEFCRLHEASDDAFLKFAMKWGILGIRPIREVAIAEDLERHLDKMALGMLPRPVRLGLDSHSWTCEKVSMWRRLAAHFRSVLLCAAHLHQGKEPPLDLWTNIISVEPYALKDLQKHWHRPTTSPYFPDAHVYDASDLTGVFGGGWRSHVQLTPDNAALERQWNVLLASISRWTRQINLQLFLERSGAGALSVRLSVNHLGVDWTAEMFEKCKREGHQDWEFSKDLPYYRGEPYLPMHRSLLLNIMVTQLVAAISRVTRCDICGEPFSAERKPRYDKAALCGKRDCALAQGRVRAAKQAAKKGFPSAG